MKKLLMCPAPLIACLLLLGCGKSPSPAAANAGSPSSAPTAAGPPPVHAAGPPPVQLAAGTVFRVRLVEALDTARNRAGDRFEATLVSPVAVDGKVVLPRGTRFNGHVTTSRPSGRLRGRAYLALALDSFELNGQNHHIKTTVKGEASSSHKQRNLALIGGGSGLGALIGGLAGGGKGALIGAGSGAAAGTAGAALTGKKNVRLASETVLSFSLKSPVQVRPAEVSKG